MIDIKSFIRNWSGHGYERGETQKFWLGFLRDILDIERPEAYIDFEVQIKSDSVNYMDAYLEDSKVLIEQKSSVVKLDNDAYIQAKDYNDKLEFSRKARWIITCNFKEFHIYDMDKQQPELSPIKILLEELPDKYRAFDILVDKTKTNIQLEEEISIEAGKHVKTLYDALIDGYVDKTSPDTLKSLNVLCVRIVFCLYAESAGALGRNRIFTKIIEKDNNLRRELIALFKMLDTDKNQRGPYDKDLKLFPYIDGGIFADDNIEIPDISENTRAILLNEVCKFKWKNISPTIFGAVFEYTLNPDNRNKKNNIRHEGGMHYTSIKNIQKVIDPLFMDDLRAEFETVKNDLQALIDFQNKLATIKIFDPACGSGNFLTESYISLRRLENLVLREILNINPNHEINIKVTIEQFYGIEIHDFAVSVAKTALWISELQMKMETNYTLNQNAKLFPLKTAAHITEGNALTIDWNKIINPHECTYIISNPPFAGARTMTPAQKSDVQRIFDGWKNLGNLDYVSCWYKKVTDFINGTNIRAALVSTNSICQGDSIATLWKPIFAQGVHFDFAYRTFKWDNELESKAQAHVHCVIISFSVAPNDKPKLIFDGGKVIAAKNINAYLMNADNVFIESRNKPLCPVPEIGIGNKPIDDGNYLFTAEEMAEFIKREPRSAKYFKRWYGGYEFINNKERYCLWLGDCKPQDIKSMKLVYERVKAVREYRLNSNSLPTRKIADRPTRFHVENMPVGNYIVIPKTSSERRKYIPIGFMDDSVLCADSLKLIPNATLYHFGVLTSIVHMAWMRVVCGRLEVDYNYSNNIVYNNFIWCSATDKQKAAIELTAQAILDARARYAGASLAALYDETTMPADLRDAHNANDAAVCEAYGFSRSISEAEIVAELFKKYLELTNGG